MVNRSKQKIAIKAVHKDSIFGIFRKVYKRFIRIRGNPREVALGFALGIFVGMTPTMGVQTPIAIFFAALCGWSKLSAAIGVWISNPLTAPVIYGVTYITGAKMMHLAPVFKLPLSPTWSTLKAMLMKAPQALGAMTVGGIVIGLPLAVLAYYLSYGAVEKYQKDVKEKLVRQKAKLADTKEKVKKKVLERKAQSAEEDGLMPADRRQRTEDRRQRTENRGLGKDDRRKRTDDRRQSAEDRCQMTEDRWEMTDDRCQMPDDRERSAGDSEKMTAGSAQVAEDKTPDPNIQMTKTKESDFEF